MLYRYLLLVILCLSHCTSLSAQVRTITINGNLSLANEKKNKYVYFIANKRLERKELSSDGKFTFQTKADLTDTLLYARTLVSDKLYKDYDEHITDIRAGRISVDKDYFNFIIDSTYIHLGLMPSNRKINVRGGHENRGDMAYKEIIAHRDLDYNKPNPDLSAINREANRKIIALATQYNNSISAIGWLRGAIISMKRDFTHQEAILSAIDNLDESVLKHRVGELRKFYASTVAKYTPKEDVLFPNTNILVDRTGDEVNLLDRYKTYEYVLIDFWATWCAPCIQQHPQIKAMAAKYEDNSKIAIVGISVDKKKEDWSAYIDKTPFNYPNYWLAEKDHERVVNNLGIVTIPRYMLLHTKDNVLVEMKMDIGEIDDILRKYSGSVDN